MIRHITCSAVLAVIVVAPGARAQGAPLHPTLVYAMGQEATLPIPIIGAETDANAAVADQLFLHLAVLGPTLRVAGDNALQPALARRWHRVDPLTVVFEIDPRARWHDGTPVSAHDLVFSWKLATSPVSRADQSRLENIESVDAIDAHSVRVRYKRPSSEQVYTFAFLLQPLPAHLLERMAPEAIATSAFAAHPIGNGPFRFARRVAGQLTELHADSTFFLGKPGIERVIFRYVEDPAARLTAFLTGETDIIDNIPAPSLPQVEARHDVRLLRIASGDLLYALFNTRSATDTSRSNPVTGDPRVREALTLALDRVTIAGNAFGPGTAVPDAAQSAAWQWITPGNHPASHQDIIAARRLLNQAGWTDANHDGLLEKNGVPLHLTMIYPASSPVRHDMGIQMQQMWRAIGAQADLERIDASVYIARRQSGRWDLDMARATQDPTPSSLVQSWSCTTAMRPGSSNVAKWCDSTFDRLVATASAAKDPAPKWRDALVRMIADRPAIFLAAPVAVFGVHSRYDNVSIWPSRPWISLWQWHVRPAAALPRDR